jgi:hypothetical protein
MTTLAPLTMAEIDGQTAELLPAREALSSHFSWTTHWANISATNLSIALNAASLGSTAMSQANQTISVHQ